MAFKMVHTCLSYVGSEVSVRCTQAELVVYPLLDSAGLVPFISGMDGEGIGERTTEVLEVNCTLLLLASIAGSTEDTAMIKNGKQISGKAVRERKEKKNMNRVPIL